MSLEEIEEVTDDITGEPDAATFRFGWMNQMYEIDLSGHNAAELQALMAKLLPHARRVHVPSITGARKPAQIRGWWEDNAAAIESRTGQPFRERGSIPPAVELLFAVFNGGSVPKHITRV